MSVKLEVTITETYTLDLAEEFSEGLPDESQNEFVTAGSDRVEVLRRQSMEIALSAWRECKGSSKPHTVDVQGQLTIERDGASWGCPIDLNQPAMASS